MTAEFAVVLPAVIVVLLFALLGLQLVGEQVRLQFAADGAARAFGRGDDAAAATAVDAVPGASASEAHHDDLACANVTAPVQLGLFAGLFLAASACALDDGQ